MILFSIKQTCVHLLDMSGLCVLCLLTALQAITTNRVKSIDTTKKHALTQQQYNNNNNNS